MRLSRRSPPRGEAAGGSKTSSMTRRPDTSVSAHVIEGSLSTMWATPPRIVAEHLRTVREPLALSLIPGPPASGAEVGRALARRLLPAEHPATPPAWLQAG